MGQFVKVQGTLPQAEIWLHFALPDLSKEYESQPLEYIDHMLSYGGEDSLTRVLQDNLGLVTSLDSMASMNSAGTSLFVIMHLTKTGQAHMPLILDVFYEYLGKLRKQGVDEKLYDSLARIKKLKWDWAEPSSPADIASALAERMVRLPVDHLLSGDDLIDRQNSSLVASLMEKMQPANMNLIYVDAVPQQGNTTSSNAEANEYDKTLPYYNVKYSVQSFAQKLPGATQRWNAMLTGHGDSDQLVHLPEVLAASGRTASARIPGPIEGVPAELPLEHMKAAQTEADLVMKLYGSRPTKIPALKTSNAQSGQLLEAGPSLLAEDGELWYRSGWATTSPKAQLQLVLRPKKNSSAPEKTASDDVRLAVFGSLLAESLVPKMVDLSMTGVGYSVDASLKGLSFTFSGFTPMMPQLITKVLQEFNSFNGNASATQEARFKRVTQSIREDLKTYADMPVSYAIADRNMLLTRNSFSRAETLEALEKVTRDSAASSVNGVLLSQPVRLTSLVMGNIAKQEANDAISTFVGGLKTPGKTAQSPTKDGEPERVMPVVRIVKPVEVRAKNPRAGDSNDAVVLSLVSGVSTVKNRVVFGILGKILSALAYNELRTARQLGYVVNAGASQVSNVQYMSCVVQGNALNADAQEAAIEHVLTHLMPKRLSHMIDKEFDTYKATLRQELLQPPQKFQDEVSYFWGPIVQGGQCFNLRSSMVKYLDESLKSKDVLLQEWTRLANPINGTRSKIAVKYFANAVPPRPTLENATATWRKQGVDDSTFTLLEREYQNANVFDHVDSKVREQLVKEGGYFPQDLNCDVPADVAKSSSKQFLKKISSHGDLEE
jgi:secreted Zn-dependent insulinase-like peptidase